MAHCRFPPWSVKERTLAKKLLRLVRMKGPSVAPSLNLQALPLRPRPATPAMPNPELMDFQIKEIVAYFLSLQGQSRATH